MTDKDRRPGDAANLRQQAEEVAREEAAPSPQGLEALSPEETRRTLHELRVHQIELEVQNEELRRAQAELDAARARYFDLYDLAPVGYCTVSEEGLILEANLTAATLLGVARGALGKRPLNRFILKEDEDIYYLRRKQLFETAAPQACELRMVKTDGTQFWARLEATAARDEGGAPVLRVVLSDITDRKRAEAALEQEAALLAQAETISHMGSWRMVLETGTLTWSDGMYGILGIERTNLNHSVGEALALAAHPEDRAALDELNSAILGDGFPRPIDFRIVRPGGVVRWVHAQGQQERDETGRVVALAGFVQDITDRKRAEAALQEKVEELRQALDQIKTLSGILPICMHCKKIRDDKGSWNRMEIYIRDRTEAEFSHGICPECMKKLYPEVRGMRRQSEGGDP